MFIASSNANGWGKAKTAIKARDIAFRNSVVMDDRVMVRVWPCQDDAHIDHFGDAFGVIGKPVDYKRSGKSWKIVPAEEAAKA